MPVGHMHPISRTIWDVTQVFVKMGFHVEEGPEVETDYYNFQALNIPADHPARDMQDRKSTRLNSSHSQISYAVFCLKKKTALLSRLCSSPRFRYGLHLRCLGRGPIRGQSGQRPLQSVSRSSSGRRYMAPITLRGRSHIMRH